MANPREQANRSMTTLIITRAIKRHRYDERALIQILKVAPDKAKAILAGQLDGFSTDELGRIVNALE